MIKNISSSPLNAVPGDLVDRLSRSYGEYDGFAVLESAGCPKTNASLSNASFILLEPVLSFVCSAKTSRVYNSQGLLAEFNDPWQALRTLAAVKGEFDRLPIAAGYIGYEALHLIEDVPSAGLAQIPDYVFYIYSKIIRLGADNQCSLHEVSFEETNEPFWRANLDEHLSSNQTKQPQTTPKDLDLRATIESHSNFSQSKYLKTVSEIQEGIIEGDYYQVNLSQQISLPWEKKASEYFSALRRVSPAAFSAFFNINSECINPFSIISSSPELFFQTSADEIICSPIKGTRPRATSPAEDARLRDELSQSDKDRAELAMIVDLVRNDLGRIAKTGSVQVVNHARLETLAQVHHLVSDIKCEPADGIGLVDIIKALFPCGSITGAPKIAAMKAIAKHEKCPRGVYTGAIGCINSDGTSEFNVAIRTATIFNKKLIFNVGGGIVVGSEPAAEYDETLAKAKGMMKAWALLHTTE